MLAVVCVQSGWKNMLKEDCSIIRMLDEGELAFLTSRFADYQDSGRERFLRDWISKYQKQTKDKYLKKFIANKFLAFKKDKDLVDKWKYHVKSYQELKFFTKQAIGVTDLDRIKSLARGWSEYGVQTTLGEEVIGSTATNDRVLITGESFSKIVDGNIPVDICTMVRIEHCDEIEPREIVSQLMNYGFAIGGDFEREEGVYEFELSGANLCPNLAQLME